MMARRAGPLASALLLAASCPVAAAPLQAQQGGAGRTLERDCRAATVQGLGEAEIGEGWVRYHPDRIFTRIQPLIGAGAWNAAMDTVVARGREALLLADSTVQRRVGEELLEARRLFRAATQLTGDAQSRVVADSLRPARWQLSQHPVTGAYRLFAPPRQLLLTDSTPSDTRRAACWTAITVARVMTLYRSPARDTTVEVLARLADSWDRYIDHSYSQLPWELALNGLGRSRTDWNPPDVQWILLHPSVGAEVAGLSRRQLQRLEVAVLEGVGVVWYRADHTRYLGISGVATFASDRAMALGAYVHLWFPQAKVGYVVRPDDDRKRRRSLLVTVDLYDLLTGVPQNLKAAKDAALAAAGGAK